LLVGCVDNPAARRELARTLEPSGYGPSSIWWLDLGNGSASGQVYLGNALRPDGLRHAFDPVTRTCRALPAPSVQAPELLEVPTAPLPDLDCAAAQMAGDLEPFVNRAIAALGLMTGHAPVPTQVDLARDVLRPERRHAPLPARQPTRRGAARGRTR
jgi:hypothetical protein